jgi:hypothetical protein
MELLKLLGNHHSRTQVPSAIILSAPLLQR